MKIILKREYLLENLRYIVLDIHLHDSYYIEANF